MKLRTMHKRINRYAKYDIRVYKLKRKWMGVGDNIGLRNEWCRHGHGQLKRALIKRKQARGNWERVLYK